MNFPVEALKGRMQISVSVSVNTLPSAVRKGSRRRSIRKHARLLFAALPRKQRGESDTSSKLTVSAPAASLKEWDRRNRLAGATVVASAGRGRRRHARRGDRQHASMSLLLVLPAGLLVADDRVPQ